MDLYAHLQELEGELHQCSTRTDGERLAQLLADDFVEFGASGHVWGSRAEVIAGLRDEVFSARSMSEFALKVLAEGVVLVTYRCRRTATVVTAGADSLRSSVWREEEGRWRMVFHQGTPVAEL
ncbi:DUF4440 domain-containing protein [Pseudomonas sp. ADAK18]|uniref:nuclear transport factor 2 family protein n=1 Tax=Pseudomonas sp. ADAK18 TaxID=2730848 RepID=UPI0015B54D8E|nr:DUF4440 domain-containing protein [Pseudomonas sp. ADAK18]